MTAPAEYNFSLQVVCDADGNLGIWVDGDEIADDLTHGTQAMAMMDLTFKFPHRQDPTPVEATAPPAGEVKTS